MKRAVLFALICGAVALSGSYVHAACPATSPTPIGHFLTGYMDCDDTGRVQGFIYQISAPTTTNSGPLNVACASANGPSLTCTGSSPGDVGDHHLTIETDATIFGWNGCPVGATPNRIIAVAIDSAGNSAMLSVSGKDPSFGYFLEMAHQTTDGSDIIPVACAPSGRPKVLSVSNDGTTVNLQLTVPPAAIHTDCDPGSLGKLFTDGGGSTACDGFVATPVMGRLYTSTQPCGFADITAAKWTASAVTPDASGNAAISGPAPAAGSGNCFYVAGSTTVTGSPELLTGFVSVGQLSSTPKAENLKATNLSGKVTLTWSTSVEVGLAAFKVLAQSKAKGSFEVATVAPKGNGGAANYTLAIGMGDLKGARSLIVRAVQTDGTFIDSAAFTF